MSRAPVVVGTAILLVALAWLAVGVLRPHERPVDQAAATALARTFFEHAHGEGSAVSNVQILAVSLGVDDRQRDAWKVNISGDVTEAGRTAPSYSSYMWLYVDAETGEVRVLAQG